MNKTWIIIQREYAVRIKKKSFIILTILMPFLIAAIVFVPAILATQGNKEVDKVAIVDVTGKYAPLFKTTEKVEYTVLPGNVPFEEQCKDFQSKDSPYNAVIYIPTDLTDSANLKTATIYSKKQIQHELEKNVNDVLSEKVRQDRLESYQITNIEKIIADAAVKVSVKTEKWDEDGNVTASSSAIAGCIGIVLSLFIYMFILAYGSMVMQSVSEEKTNRIVEIMVSSVKPHQLMFGKMVGIALVGLTQFLIWALMLASIIGIAGAVFGLSSSPEIPAAAMSGMAPASPAVNEGMNEFLQILQGMNLTEIAVLFVLYFIGGYLLFASLFAAIGASINEQQDSQQFMMPIILIFVFALYAGMFSIENPDGPLALWCSFIPFTSPIVMMVRIAFNVPMWQIILSLALLYGTSGLIVWISAKIYRVGILMYGKKPTVQDMIKWIRYK